MKSLNAYTVSHAIVEELIRVGVDTVYGIVSIHNMPIYEAIREKGDIRIVTARGESGAVNMADAHSRATGKLGVVITSTGSGAGNAAGSLVETWNSGTPLLHITGEADSEYIGTDQRYIHEAKNQQQMMEGAGKSSYLLKRPKQVTPYIRQSIEEAFTAPYGPVTLNIPTNLQTKVIPENHLVHTTVDEKVVTVPNEVIQLITEAKRPVLWTGKGVIIASATEEVRNLVDIIQPAVITSEAGKGIVPESHPLCIGNFAATEQVESLLRNADLLISAGVHFRADETFDWSLPIPKNHINIDLDSNAFNRNFDTLYSLVGDARSVFGAINDELKNKTIEPNQTYVNEVKQVKQTVQSDLRKAVYPYGDIADIMNEHMTNNAVLVTDVTIPGYTWGNKLIEINEPRNYMHMAGGGIGQGLPMAIGAQISQSEKPVYLIVGDGGFMVNIGEMMTATEQKAPIKVLLFDDGGYGILQYYQQAAYGEQTAVHLENPDFVKLAESMGFRGEKVTTIEEFETGMSNAAKSNDPYMIVVDVSSIGSLEYEDSPDYIKSFRPQYD